MHDIIKVEERIVSPKGEILYLATEDKEEIKVEERSFMGLLSDLGF